MMFLLVIMKSKWDKDEFCSFYIFIIEFIFVFSDILPIWQPKHEFKRDKSTQLWSLFIN